MLTIANLVGMQFSVCGSYSTFHIHKAQLRAAAKEKDVQIENSRKEIDTFRLNHSIKAFYIFV